MVDKSKANATAGHGYEAKTQTGQISEMTMKNSQKRKRKKVALLSERDTCETQLNEAHEGDRSRAREGQRWQEDGTTTRRSRKNREFVWP